MNKIIKKVLCLSLGVIAASGIGMSTMTANAATLSTKEKYYNEYQTIVDEAKVKYKANLKLDAIDSFDENNMLTPKEFKEMVDQIGTNQFKVEKATQANKEDSVIGQLKVGKDTTVSTDSNTFSIQITADIDTMLGLNRQIIDSVTNIDASGLHGCSWAQKNGKYRLLDGRRTAEVMVQGDLYYGGLKWLNKDAKVSFYCTATGNIR